MNMTQISIRHATLQDNILLADLGRQTFRDTFAADNTPENMAAYLAASFSPEKQAAELAAPASLFLIAQAAGEAVGYARLKEGPAPACITGRHPIEIVRIYARQEWIGHHVGARLMQACLDRAAERDCDIVWLDVWERNLRARAFYAKWDFVQVGSQTFQLGADVQNDLLMQRPVKPSR